MRKKIIYFLIILLSFVLGIFIRIYIHQKEEMGSFYNELKEYFSEFKKFDGIPQKVLLVKFEDDTPLISNLFKDKEYLILYFRVTDCLTCLEEMRHMIDTFKNLSNLKILVATDHPILYEIKFFMYKLRLKEVIWDKDSHFLGSKPLKTPFYVLIKKNKIKKIGIIAPLKEEGMEVYGLYTHKLKKRLKL
ncbi:MAG: hypothetical protein ABIM62_05575 [candidate division WOR-3 bacterium]